MAHELFSRIADILSAPSEAQALIMHETLVIACHEGLKNTRHGFGNLSSQVESLCRQHNIAPQDIVAIQKMRRHSNSNAPILPEDVAYDCRAWLFSFLLLYRRLSLRSLLEKFLHVDAQRRIYRLRIIVTFVVS